MAERSRTKQLNDFLRNCQSVHRQLEHWQPNLAHTDPGALDPDRREIIACVLFAFLYTIDKTERLLEQVKLDGAIETINQESLNFYRETLRPSKSETERLFSIYRQYLDTDINWEQWEQQNDNVSTWAILVEGHELLSTSEHDVYSDDQLDDVKRLLFSPFFTPDEWLINAKDLDPVLGESADHRIPGHVRVRVQELYKSYILGNHLSVIALGRAILEYTLVDRASVIGINPYTNNERTSNRILGLRALVDKVSNVHPELQFQMESIVETGNRTLHPKKRDKVILHPSALRSLSKETVDNVRLTVEQLYLTIY